jgi:hypothetical protein
MVSKPGGWTALCPGDGCKNKLGTWSDAAIETDGSHQLPGLEKGFVLDTRAGAYRRTAPRNPSRGRQLARAERATGFQFPKYGENRGATAQWGAPVVCDECGGWALVLPPATHGSDCRLAGCQIVKVYERLLTRGPLLRRIPSDRPPA